MTTELMKRINDPLFDQLLNLLLESRDKLTPELSASYQQFFVSIMPKFQKSHYKVVFDSKFNSDDQLEDMTIT